MFGIHEDEPEDTQFLQTVRQSYEGVEMPLVDLKFKASVTVDGSSLSAEDADGHMALAQGPRPERAVNVALSQQMLAARVAKTGGTPFRCASVQAYVDPGLMLSAAAINGMRRDVLNQMTALRARREEHPVKKARDRVYYTQGYNPHIYLSFSCPLSLGQESLCESCEVKTEQELSLIHI